MPRFMYDYYPHVTNILKTTEFSHRHFNKILQYNKVKGYKPTRQFWKDTTF